MKQVPVRSREERGSEILEFAGVFLPFIAMVTVLVNMAWMGFAQMTIQRAVRVAVDYGVQLDGSQLAVGACLTDSVKSVVQTNSMGMLNGTTGLALIKVHYYQPPNQTSTGAATDVTGQSTADYPGNLMQVSVTGYSQSMLTPRIADWNHPADNTPLPFTVYGVGSIQTVNSIPCVGTAP